MTRTAGGPGTRLRAATGQRRRPQILTGLWLSLGFALPALSPIAAEAAIYAGQSLEATLDQLRADGLPIVFSSRLVRPGMRVETEPAATSPRRLLAELLRPHGLRARQGPGAAGWWSGGLGCRRRRPTPRPASNPRRPLLNSRSRATKSR